MKSLRPASIIFGATALILFVLSLPHIVPVVEYGFDIHALQLFNQNVYARTVIAPDYFDYGFIRRGLGGTIGALLGTDPVGEWTGFLLFSAVFLAVPLAILIARQACRASTLWAVYAAAVLLLSPQTLFSWSQDVGRTDILAAAFVAWAVLALLGNMRALAVLLMLAGLLAHEVALVFGGPLLTAMALHDIGQNRMSRRAGLIMIAGLLALAVLTLGLQQLLAPPPQALAAQIMEEVYGADIPREHQLWRDLAVYMAVGGRDAIETAMCLNFSVDQNYFYTAALCLLVLSCYFVILPLWDRPVLIALAALVPVVFMLIIANDAGRWLSLSVLNCWLLAIFRSERGDDLLAGQPGRMLAGLLLLAGLIWMGTTSYNHANPFTRAFADLVGTPLEIGFDEWLDICDPGWRTFLHGGDGSAS